MLHNGRNLKKDILVDTLSEWVMVVRSLIQIRIKVDVDFSIVSDKLSVEWNNFHHPHLDLYFNVCAGTTIGGCDVTMEEKIDGSISKHTFNSLVLTVFQVKIILCKQNCSKIIYGQSGFL
jgi:hypothetical protein